MDNEQKTCPSCGRSDKLPYRFYNPYYPVLPWMAPWAQPVMQPVWVSWPPTWCNGAATTTTYTLSSNQ